ncbi:SRPBCC family protein [Actinopolymorpha sp. B17G11]|uniref:SRPBCC family protein n=1 Tax=unclassified Actinopolymorpha TaxID=2627063 RepID=UPI0032D960DD
MSETAAKGKRGQANLSDIGDGVRKAAAKNPATQRLLDEGQQYVSAKAQRMIQGLGGKIGGMTRGLSDVAEGKASPGGLLAGTLKETLGGASPGKAMAKAGVKSVGEKVKSMFKGGGKGGGSGRKSMNIVEDLNVGVPLRVAYNHWTQFDQFPRWSKGAQSVDVDEGDRTQSNWKAKVAWSNRSWKATITEQIPDERITWRTEGQTEVNGTVSFHPLEDELTKILVVLEYTPHGFFEKTANLWRAPGRRARLDLKLFRRYAMMQAEEEDADNGWRGEVRDGEIVRDHDEVVKAEKEREGGEEPEGEGEEREEPTGEEEREEREPRAEEEEEQEGEEEPDEKRRARPPRQRRSEERRSKEKARR